MDEDDFRSLVKEEVGFSSWPPPEDEAVYRHFIGYRPPVERVAGFRGVEIESCAMLSSALHARKARVVVGPEPSSNVLISFAECRDGLEAREVLIDAFASAMSVEHIDPADLHMKLGEIGFLGPGGVPAWGLFVRGNLVLFVQTGSLGAPPIVPILDLLDRDLIDVPSASSAKPGPEIIGFQAGVADVEVGERVPFTFEYHDGVHEFLTARLETTVGPIERDTDGRLSLVTERRGDHLLILVLSSQDERVTRREIRVVVR